MDLPAERTDITASAAWLALQAHFDEFFAVHLRELFAADPRRGTEMTIEAADLHFDYSKQRVSTKGIIIHLALRNSRMSGKQFSNNQPNKNKGQ